MSEDKYEDWRDDLMGCFGVMDLKFALHPSDEGRAKSMMRLAKMSGASLDDIQEAVRVLLDSKGAKNDHIEEQLGWVIELGGRLEIF